MSSHHGLVASRTRKADLMAVRGSPDCPCETAWGLVDRKERPKPAYHAFKEGIRRLLE